MTIFTEYAVKSGCYKANKAMPNNKPCGLFWHSTGADNPNLKRYAGYIGITNKIIGENPNENGFYNSPEVCPNAILGKGTDGKLYFVKILPDTICPWCSGSGDTATAKSNGFSGNNANYLSFYQIEICEDTLLGKEYADEIYANMVEFSVQFFKDWFDGDPDKVMPKTLTSHAEANKMGIASGHVDPWHWLGKYGYSGDILRKAVKEQLSKDKLTQTSNKIYRVQVGAFSVKANATEYLAKLKAAGFDGYVVEGMK